MYRISERLLNPKPPARGWCALIFGLSLLLFLCPEARAQTDINPPLPNVLLLVDTSGSMEYKTGGTDFPACDPDGSSSSERSRWIDLVEVMTGSITNYRCQSIDRADSSFRTGEYGTGGPTGVEPYDYLYDNPFHRPMSGECVAAPGVLTSNAYEFPEDDPTTTSTYEGAIRFHTYGNLTTDCNFNQSQNGVLDAFERSARFGLMTFDPLPDPGTGVTGVSPDFSDGRDGTWSYAWGSSVVARPEGCSTDQPFEVGARNAAAPPWEGRMVPFGEPGTGSLEFLTKKSQIERVLLSTRPYGATPIAGMLEDAKDFLLDDDSNDPVDSSKSFGPKDDPYITGGCRDQYVILLTDGQPNMDLRPYCGSDCPFDTPEQIAFELAGGDPPIHTYVVGFALDSFDVGGTDVTCAELDDDDFDETDASALCGNPDYAENTALQACCSLNRIATNGSDQRASFAESQEQLAGALSAILAKTGPITSRTQPVVSGGVGGSTGLRFFTSVEPKSFQAWAGVLERQRFTCEAETDGDGNTIIVPTAQDIAASEGDDFAANVNNYPDDRVIWSVEGGIDDEDIFSSSTIRPYIDDSDGDPDGAGAYKGEQYAAAPDDFVDATTADAMALTDTSCTDNLSADECRDRYLKWLVGIDNDTRFTRCAEADCSVFGAILHSTPKVVGPPSEFLRDETYERFALENATRPTVLYTSTNDGFLHAFKVAAIDEDDEDHVPNGETNNELWAFIPPAVLPQLPTQYPFTHQQLLDGVPVIKDVVATITEAQILLQRSSTDAQAGTGNWRTILVQSFGTGRPGYFAIDVTSPVPDPDDLSGAATGPRFLWQLTNDGDGDPLFGLGGATPVITTLYFDPAGTDNPSEIAVAILPGGSGGAGSGTCPTTPRDFTDVNLDERFAPRGQVKCYSGLGIGGRSLTIVRLDTGEIVRTFRQSVDELDEDKEILRGRVTEAAIDSPITGQPVAFPSQVGAVADRVYVGDQDGRLWKVDLADDNPANWSMDLFFDAFPATFSGDEDFGNSASEGQPILLPPVVSVDDLGDITINLATGDQDTIGASTDMKNFVWSLTERTSNDREDVLSQVNWFLPLSGGERVVGPLVLFSSKLYFSSYAPPSDSDVCANGTSRVWGMDYLRPIPAETADEDPPVDQGGEAALPNPNDPDDIEQVLTAEQVTGDASSVIFGVSVAQVPTCSSTSTDTPSDFLGYGVHHQITSVNPGEFQLVMHTGSGGVGIDSSAQTKAKAITLQTPANTSRIDSWAPLVE